LAQLSIEFAALDVQIGASRVALDSLGQLFDLFLKAFVRLRWKAEGAPKQEQRNHPADACHLFSPYLKVLAFAVLEYAEFPAAL
jgi:hypothetical protein